jgi:hypothetical protein
VRLGIDLDNTIIDYSRAFAEAARALGVSGAFSGKTALRDALRAGAGGDEEWQRVQARAYGPLIERAEPFPGVEAFFSRARERGVPLTIVSHKSSFAGAAPDGPNLRECARAWLGKRGFIAAGEALYFESTRVEKCARIERLQLTHFIDDLVEVFAEPAFPRTCERWLFAPLDDARDEPADRIFRSWEELAAAVL